MLGLDRGLRLCWGWTEGSCAGAGQRAMLGLDRGCAGAGQRAKAEAAGTGQRAKAVLGLDRGLRLCWGWTEG